MTSIPAQHRDQADDVVLVNDGPDFELLDQSYMEQQQQQILKIEQVDFEIVGKSLNPYNVKRTSSIV